MDRREEIEEVVELTVVRAVPEAVKHTLEHYGFDVRNPTEVQLDQQWVRASRRFFGSLAVRILSVLVLGGVTAATAWALSHGKLPTGG